MVAKFCSRSHGQPVPGVRSAAMISISRAMSREGFMDEPSKRDRQPRPVARARPTGMGRAKNVRTSVQWPRRVGLARRPRTGTRCASRSASIQISSRLAVAGILVVVGRPRAPCASRRRPSCCRSSARAASRSGRRNPRRCPRCVWSLAMWPIERSVVPPILRTRSAMSSVVAKMSAACSSSIRW